MDHRTRFLKSPTILVFGTLKTPKSLNFNQTHPFWNGLGWFSPGSMSKTLMLLVSRAYRKILLGKFVQLWLLGVEYLGSKGKPQRGPQVEGALFFPFTSLALALHLGT